MNQKTRRKTLAIIGIHPPPYGGVGVHLKRLVKYLDSIDYDYIFYNTGPTTIEHPNVINVGWSLSWFLRLLLFGKHKIIHAHTGRWWARVGISLFSMLGRCKLIFTAHSYHVCEEFNKGNFIKKWLVKTALRKTPVIIAVNNVIKKELIEIGVPEQNIHLIPAFIPPPDNVDGDKIPPEVEQFCRDKSPVLVASSAFIIENGKDLYGLEMTTNLMELLLKDYPNAALIVYLGGTLGSDESAFKELISRINTEPLKSHILFYRSNQDFYPVLKLADMFLRPTLTDGDALSVREALCFGVPVVASDVIKRPDNAILFKTDDSESFNQTVLSTLNELDEHKEKLKHVKTENFAEKILKIYNNLQPPI